MPRLQHAETGVIVSVRDEKAERMGSEWVPVDKVTKAPAKKAVAPTVSK